MGKSKIVSLAPTRLFNTKKHSLNSQNQETELFSETKILLDLGFLVRQREY